MSQSKRKVDLKEELDCTSIHPLPTLWTVWCSMKSHWISTRLYSASLPLVYPVDTGIEYSLPSLAWPAIRTDPQISTSWRTIPIPNHHPGRKLAASPWLIRAYSAFPLLALFPTWSLVRGAWEENVCTAHELSLCVGVAKEISLPA